MFIKSTLDYARSLPLISQGLSEPYSPNHIHGLTTTQHVYRQLEMLDRLQDGDYETLQQWVNNENVAPDKRVRVVDLQELLAPLIAGWENEDWQVLAAVSAFHDSGKMSQAWAARGEICLEGVEWIAHDFDSEIILRNNPKLLAPLELTAEQSEVVMTMCRLHSLPGQFFFGEGNLTAYQPLTDHPRWLKIARVQGVVDVMSALNASMVRPILASHAKLSSMLNRANANNLHQLMLKDSQTEATDPLESLGPIAQHRLQRLSGLKPSVEQLQKIEQEVGRVTMEAFRACTEGSNSWYGTYVANAFGSGLMRALGDSTKVEEVLAALIRVVAGVAQCYQGPRKEWALSALHPALLIQSSPAQAQKLLRAANSLVTPEKGAELLTGRIHTLTARLGDTGIALEMH